MEEIDRVLEKHTPQLRIAVFPKGQDLWRIDWFGSIAFPDRMVRRKQPSVLVYLSKVIAPDALTHPSVLLTPQSTLPAGQQIKRWVSVGTLMLLRVGDLWRDQILVATPEYERATFSEIVLDRDTVQMIKAGSSFEDTEGFLLPLAEHPWHLGNTHSYCVKVTMSDGRFLVVPCMELIRFYFGSSSELLSRLFMPPLSRDCLYSKVKWSFTGKQLTLHLAERLPRASAADVARIAGDESAWKAALLISSSCLKASVAMREIYPQAVFPFEGNATLEVTGKWLSQGDKPHQTFLVYQLRFCSHPFPFKSLSYSVFDKKYTSTRPLNSDSKAIEQKSKIMSPAKLPAQANIKEQDASSTLSGSLQTVTPRRHFPDLEKKTIWANKAFSSSKTSIMLASEPVNDVAVGEPGSSKRVRQVTIAEAMSGSNKAVIPSFLTCIAGALKDLRHMVIKVVTASHEDDWTVPLTLVSDADGVIPEAYFINENNRLRPRRIAVFSVETGVQHVLIAVVESNPLVPFLYGCNVYDTDGVVQALEAAAKDHIDMTANPDNDRFSIEWPVVAEAETRSRIQQWVIGMFLFVFDPSF